MRTVEESFAGDFKEQTIALMVGERRRVRRTNAVKVASALALAALGALWCIPRSGEPVGTITAQVETAPWIVQSVSFNGIVRSEGLPDEMVIRTSERPLYENLNDEQLLAYFNRHSVAFVKGGGFAELEVFDR